MPADHEWDHYSDQPYRIAAESKPGIDGGALVEYLKTLATATVISPSIIARYLTLAPRADIDPEQFVGLSISARPEWQTVTAELIEELGVKNLLLRIPARDAGCLEDYQRVFARFPHHRFIVNILQDRDSVRLVDDWTRNVARILGALPPNAAIVQIANAVNRKKWGCHHTGDYLRLEQAIQHVRASHPRIQFLGSSVIDFEPLVSIRTLVNWHRFHNDGVAAELYVNRRGSPFSRQFGFFDLNRKIRLLAAIATLSNRSRSPLVVTETNWPLLNTRPFTPNSGDPRSTVDEETQAAYLKDYYRIAWATRLVHGVYWWQLINPGYGLVDHRHGRFRKLPSFYAFRDVVNGGFRTEQ